ncbi:MAG: hypothetical protein HZB16_13820 [Armatimonadetes bacterium]|nr:hypothetical protein [Armatimonadota bacterium]
MRTLRLLPAIILALTAAFTAEPTRDEVLATALPAADRSFRSATTEPPPPNLSSRELFSAALVYAEAKRNLDRIAPLLDRAASMQDTDPASRGYGNFHWYFKQTEVQDYNAVDFAMQHATLLWRLHRDELPADARTKLKALLDLSTEGCLRHRVNPNYTNIALMNAGNLILLGELLDRAPVADEGYRRLDNAARDIWDNGIHEYLSPTYYGVDLIDLALIEAHAQRPAGVATARALLAVFGDQVAASWFEPNLRLGGPCSRDYDYLRGLGMLHTPLWVWGWPIGRVSGGVDAVAAMLTRWRPSAELMARPAAALPRLARGKFGPALREAWTQYVEADVSLGSAGTSYHNMDIPLCVQFAGGSQQVRGYFIADGRHDPYGKVRIPESSGGHEKTLHLLPFWAAAQTRHDALAYVAYRPQDVPAGTKTLESHMVLPRNVDSIWLDDERLKVDGKAWQVVVPPGTAVTLRRGTAAVSLKVLAARGCDGKPAPVTLGDDGNAFDALRLTITHAAQDATGGQAAAVLWVRVAGGIANAETEFIARRDFIKAAGSCELGADSAKARATGHDGDLALDVAPKWGPVRLTPTPSRAVLEVNGVDVGRQRLAQVEPFASFATEQARLPRVDLAADRDTMLEAESGQVRANLTIADDPAASGGNYVWCPGEPGGKGGASGSIRWRIRLAAAARLYGFGRVIAPTPDDDSFYFAVSRPDQDVAEPLTWSTGTHANWEWSPLGALDLPAGESILEIRGREDGTRLDKLVFSPRADTPR